MPFAMKLVVLYVALTRSLVGAGRAYHADAALRASYSMAAIQKWHVLCAPPMRLNIFRCADPVVLARLLGGNIIPFTPSAFATLGSCLPWS
jgi:hypothetical protein